MRPVVAVPIKPFASSKGRLAAALDAGERRSLMQATAGRILRGAGEAGALAVVVTGDTGVAAWAHDRGFEVLAEPPGGGLDGAARAAAEGAVASGSVWCVVHGDLPLLTPAHLEAVLSSAMEGTAVLAPSRTGGTNIIAAGTLIDFRYGPDSFRRHLAAFASHRLEIVVTTGTALDLDTPADLAAAAGLPGGGWLAGYLT